MDINHILANISPIVILGYVILLMVSSRDYNSFSEIDNCKKK